MSRTALIITILVLGATTAAAGTFSPTPYLAEADVDIFTKTVANAQFGRDLFGDPYATVVIGNVDVYDRFPYLESHYFQVVSDPAWDRLLVGEAGKGLVAFDGEGSVFGALSSPRGLATDEAGRLYVADSGNNRVLVFETSSEFDRIELEPAFAISGLNDPYDVAFSDGGTPFDGDDDRLYIANTGRNEVRAYKVTGKDAQLVSAIGELGSGMNKFAGPMALTVGHRDGAASGDVYVSDAHNGRLVRLIDTGSALVWDAAVAHGMGTVTSLDSDHWGNVYAAAPQAGTVEKFTAALFPVASYDGDIKRPRNFHVPFANVTDHRTGERSRAGQGSGIVVEEWDGDNGIRMVNLGVDMSDAVVHNDKGAAVSMTLTDHATVTATITDPQSGVAIARHDAGTLGAGRRTITFDESDFLSSWDKGEYRMTIEASSTYDKSRVHEMDMPVVMKSSGSPSLPGRLTLLGNAPNPFNPTTMIRFTVPAGPSRSYSVRVFDVQGRLVRELASGRIDSGYQQVLWDGRSDGGQTVGSGIYFYRVEVGAEKQTGKMVLLK